MEGQVWPCALRVDSFGSVGLRTWLQQATFSDQDQVRKSSACMYGNARREFWKGSKAMRHTRLRTRWTLKSKRVGCMPRCLGAAESPPMSSWLNQLASVPSVSKDLLYSKPRSKGGAYFILARAVVHSFVVHGAPTVCVRPTTKGGRDRIRKSFVTRYQTRSVRQPQPAAETKIELQSIWAAESMVAT